RALLADAERVRASPEALGFLFHLIVEPREGIGTEMIRASLAEMRPSHPPKGAELDASAPSDEELLALRREKAELSRRAAELVALVDRLRDRDRRFREEAAQRKFDVNNLKLQLGKLKKERDSLEKEVRALTGRL